MSSEQPNKSGSGRTSGFKWVVLACLLFILGIILYRSWSPAQESAEGGPQLTAFEPIEGTKVRLAGTGIAGQELRVIINQQREEIVQVDEDGQWAIETTAFGQTGRYDVWVEDPNGEEVQRDPIPISVVVKDMAISSFDAPALEAVEDLAAADSEVVNRDAADSEQPAATSIPTPMPTIEIEQSAESTTQIAPYTQAVLPELFQFQTNVSNANVGDTIQLIWGTTATTNLTLQVENATGAILQTLDVTASGNQGLEVLSGWGERITVRLFGADGAINTATAITIGCAYGWSVEPAPADCPSVEAGQSRATQQAFDNGVMIWVQELDKIFAVTLDGQNWLVDDLFEHEIHLIEDESIVPPDGKQQPKWGFGKAWRDDVAIRNALGWATSDSVDYQASFQCSSADRCYLSTLDGSILIAKENEPWVFEQGVTVNVEETP